MTSNDGARLTVFGLTFRQHDNRHMQQILRAYGRLSSNPGNRAALFTNLFELSKDLGDEEAQNVEDWLKNGGVPNDFPMPRTATPVPTDDMEVERAGELDTTSENRGEWPEYNPADYEIAVMVADAQSFQRNEMDSEEESGNDDEASQQSEDENTPQATRLPNAFQEQNSSGNFDNWGNENVDEETPRPENECSICMEVMDLGNRLIPAKVTTTCDHDHDMRTCSSCLQRQIAEKVESGALVYLNCPFCLERLSADEVMQYATPETFARYEYLIKVSDPDIIMCLGLSCGSGQLHPDTSNPKMICNTCFFATCVRHRLPWHEGQTCEEFDCGDPQIERLEEAEATAKLLAKDQSKICPSCKQGVTRMEGCDHLSCRCGQEWCFVCLASWENILRVGSEAHHPTCINHPRKLQKSKAQQVAAQAQMTETLLGGPASEALLRARSAKNERVRAELRPKAAEAAEARMKAMEGVEKGKERADELTVKKKRVKLLPAWEER